jgi:hypothetical protein
MEVMMQRNLAIRARVEDYHVEKLQQFSDTTGLNTSQLVRLLIENAELRLAPMPGATIVWNRNTDAPIIETERAGAVEID